MGSNVLILKYSDLDPGARDAVKTRFENEGLFTPDYESVRSTLNELFLLLGGEVREFHADIRRCNNLVFALPQLVRLKVITSIPRRMAWLENCVLSKLRYSWTDRVHRQKLLRTCREHYFQCCFPGKVSYMALTGFHYDALALEYLERACRNPAYHGVYDILLGLGDELTKAADSECANQYTDASLSEYCDANGMEFLVDGSQA